MRSETFQTILIDEYIFNLLNIRRHSDIHGRGKTENRSYSLKIFKRTY